jgi:dihydrofolate reductase
MRKIVVFNLVTVDGFFAGVDGNIDWHNVDDEFNDFAIKQTAEFGGLIFGKTTYKIFEEFWPKAMDDPKMSNEDRKIGHIIDDVWKMVFSKSLKDVSWKNSKLYHDIDPKEIRSWKKYDGKDMAIFGSGTIVTQFTNLGLIDEYRLLVNPVVLGEGKSFWNGIKGKQELQLTNSRTFKNGNVLLTYVPKH